MVRALLAGTKTQTRRTLKPQPPAECSIHYMLGNESWLPADDRAPLRHHWEAWGGPLFHARPPKALAGGFTVRCPYGVPGDALWVKETHRFDFAYDHLKPTEMPGSAAVFYSADDGKVGDGFPGKTRVSLHMQRRFSRLTLRVTEMRVERLNDISEADALAEGITYRAVDSGYPGAPLQDAYFFGGGNDDGNTSAVGAYRALWEIINGPGSWAANPWVWAVTFQRV